MNTSVLEATWSDFLRDPKTVTDRLDEVDAVLHRRDGEDLHLLTESRHEAAQESMAIISRLLASVLQEGVVQERLSGNAAMPWLRFLTAADRVQFATEFIETAVASSDLGTLAPLSALIAEWRDTALVRADPRLAAALRRPHPGDGELVPRPTI
jgi:hypothetical protein